MYRAGWTSRSWQDNQRRNWDDTAARPLQCEIWYPTLASGEQRIPFGDPVAPCFDAGMAVRDAAPIAGALPCVLLSHGTGGSALQMAWLGTALARAGYLAIALNHHGHCATEPYHAAGFAIWWARATDLSCVLDLAMAEFTIDSARIDAAGFSIGGYTALAMLGARLNLQAFDDFCASPFSRQLAIPELPNFFDNYVQMKRDARYQAYFATAGKSCADPRIRSAIVLAPAMIPFLQPASLRAIEKPVQIFCGQHDGQTPPLINATLLFSQLPHSTFTRVPGAGHYVWLAEATAHGRATLPVFACDPQGVERGQVHRAVLVQISTALQWLDAGQGLPACPVPTTLAAAPAGLWASLRWRLILGLCRIGLLGRLLRTALAVAARLNGVFKRH
ncbi:alpha/beta hydrolase [Chitinibacter sp. FCG-7]|uniref:Alpha/beta hydrolase n=1 Tax=Chitinibacter mangrovi TaxID=3153927 RepID=A0AAU7FF34_9NEIS